MADISAIKLPDNTTYNIKDTTARANSGVTGVKGSAESSYKKGNVILTADQVDAIPKNTTGNTKNLRRPYCLNGLNDITLDAKVNDLRANRLAFLPADQIIIEKTTDGGSTWVDAGYSDAIKLGLFSQTRASIAIPLLNGEKNINCGLRVTFTAMRYNVPSGTPETDKYNYWNSEYVVSTERYNQLKEMYFWVSANTDTISVKLERATGAKSTTWITIFNHDSWGMTGWSGCDYINFDQGVFGGGIGQTGNYWNYRLTFFTRGPGGDITLSGRSTTSTQTIAEIRGYGDTWWTAGNTYASKDHLYSFDANKNAVFPAKVTATSFSGSLTGNVTGNVSGTASNITGIVAVANGGTGKTSGKDAANYFMNALDTGNSTPKDADYYISQYVNGGTTTTTYHRRPMSALWEYIKGKISTILGLTASTYEGSAAKVNNHTVESNVPANAKFTDTITTVTTTGTGNAVTAISASNGALTVTKGATYSNNAGTITGVTAGIGLSGGGTTGNITINSTQPNVYISKTQPTGGKAGDIWLVLID